jgi:acyl dehydratase
MSEGLQSCIERTFSQEDFDRFARLSGDDNPIHTDPEFSASTRFGRPVAHGLLLCSVLRGLVEQLAPGGRLAEQSMMFPAPTYAGEAMRFVVTVNSKRDSGWLDCNLEVTRIADGDVTCQGKCEVML